MKEDLVADQEKDDLESGVSIVIPAYNEESGIATSIRSVQEVMSATDLEWELLVVDDGSVDRTAEIATENGAQVLALPENRGYGGALKAGIRRARFEIIVITDADGTYPAQAIPSLVEGMRQYDMVVGARTGEEVAVPLVRRPAKWVLRHLAAYLAGRPIPDLNSGLRAMRRSSVRQFEHLLPSGFSFTTTITLAMLCGDHLVRYEPINYFARLGESKIRATHAIDFFFLIIRTIVYFNPLKVFIPIGAIFFLGGFAKFVYDLFIGNLSETALLGFLGGSILWAVGLISDQIAKLALRPDSR